MTLQPGDRVYVLALRKTGQITEALGRARYRVSVGGMNITCKEEELNRLESPKSPMKQRKSGVRHRPASQTRQRATAKIRTVDLHGMTVRETLALLPQEISDAIMSGCAELHVVHGLGSGKLEKAVHEFLSELPVIASYGIDPRNPGLTKVVF